MRDIITDTSALYALVDADDSHHQEARDFLEKEGANLSLVVLNTTLFEAITLIKSRLGHRPAARVLKVIRSSPRYRLVSLTEDDYIESWRVFEHYSDKSWSPFDCACLAAARRRSIDEAFAFDRHFDQMVGEGLLRVP